mgnify:CR=1 FL=1
MNLLTFDSLLINGGYFLMLVALVARDMLWLRLMLVVAQSLLGWYGLHAHIPPVAFWNFIFVGLNLVRAIALLNERRSIRLPRDQELLYAQLFTSMSRREFLYLWEMGDPQRFDGQQLVRAGERQESLVLLLDGEVVVRKENQVIARLGRGKFVAEMSFVTGEPASADVIADGHVRCLAWPQEKIRALEQLNPLLLIKLQKILARDLSGKVKAANRPTGPGRR